MILWAIRRSAFAFLVAIPCVALAQNPGPGQSPPAAASDQLLKSEELDALVASIALYPDTLLAEVLMASTYPLEVVEADRWATQNKNLKGDQLKSAVDKQSWDDSVKALAVTPEVLSMMSTKLDWTQKLGDAVLAQQPDIMDAIQRLRAKAQANNKLISTKEQKVTVKQEQNKQVIIIEPTSPDTVYVPYYNPTVVYGGWPYPAYPPYYFPPPGYIAGGIIATGVAFGAGYALGRWASGGNYWGGGVNWGGNTINVNRSVNINNINAGNTWQHNSAHRQGVRYNNTNVQQRFGNNNVRAGTENRMDFRGRSGNQVLNPGGGQGLGDRGAGNRPNVGDRGPGGGGQGLGDRGAGNRPNVGDRGPTQRPSADNRPSSGANRPQRDNAFGNVQSGKTANLQSQRGQASLGGGGAARAGGGGGGGGAARVGGGGGPRAGGGGGGGARGGGGGGRGGGGGGGGGRRSDVALKHDIILLGRLDNGLGF
ncbi:MAG TPA: DUF3300 domain-containing protein, partial [Xanthobacteraceae bacterium]|nr:DUF3300 domain-containing protein [Xanthobacteraceae bacterium]